MILSSYCNSKTGKTASLKMELDENYFSIRYIVTNAKNEKEYFRPTTKGARDARRYYENITSIYQYE